MRSSYNSKLKSNILERKMKFEKNEITHLWVFVIIFSVFAEISTNDLPSIFPKNAFGCRSKRIKSIVPSSNGAGDVPKDICMTPGCVASAHYILENMDKKVNPCDDFYEFACGNFIKKTLIPDDKLSVSQFSIVDDMLMDQLKIIFNEPIKDDDLKPFKQAKSIFQSCMDRVKIEKIGLTPMKDLFKRLGGWPVLENNWNEESFNWQEMIYKFRKEGTSVDFLIDFSVAIVFKNASARSIDVDQPPLGIDREFLVEGFTNKIVDAYYKYMVDIAVIFGADRIRANEELRKSLEFEINLANITLPHEKRKNAKDLHHPMNVTEVQKKFPVVSWLKYINTILAPTNVITEEEIIVVSVPDYLTKLDVLIRNTPKRVLANFLLWRLVASWIYFLTKQVKDRQMQFNAAVTGRITHEPRWKECVDYTVGSFHLAVGSLYIRRYFNEESRRKALEMVGDIRQEMYKMLSSVDWMDNSTRSRALDKAHAIVNHVGYPDELLDENKLLKFYEKLDTVPGDYFGSLLNISSFWTDYSYSRLKELVNKTDWITHGAPAVVNAFYHPLENSIQFPAGILQHVFFSQDRPRYLNYGAIGYVIAHEITHGFDDQGRDFDKNGNLFGWWTPETMKLFKKKAECFINQSSNFTPKGFNLKLNGINTQSEVIADNGGIRNSYNAFLEFAKKHGSEPKLPGLHEYSSQQMFWIGAANVWCSKYRPETLKTNIETGVHPPCEFRVVGTFSNQEEFARDFSCPVGSRMNPVSKCKAW